MADWKLTAGVADCKAGNLKEMTSQKEDETRLNKIKQEVYRKQRVHENRVQNHDSTQELWYKSYVHTQSTTTAYSKVLKSQAVQIGLHVLVAALDLAVWLWMVARWQADCGPSERAELPPKVRCELRSIAWNNIPGKTVELKHMM